MKEAGQCNGKSVSERKDIWLPIHFVIDMVKIIPPQFVTQSEKVNSGVKQA